MKKILIALIVVLTLTASTFAGSMADVPSNHWAYEAVNTLVAAGLIQGYPDGTFQGQNELSRYEVSVMLARLLEDIEAEQDLMLEEIDFNIRKAVHESKKDLSDEQEEDIEFIVKRLLEENSSEVTDEDVNEAYTAIEDLVVEFEDELDTLVDELENVENRVSDLEAEENYTSNVNFSGEYSVDYQQYIKAGEGKAYADPFDPEYDDDDEAKLFYEEDNDDFRDKLEQTVDLNMDVDTGDFNIDVDLGASTNNFVDGGLDELFNLNSFGAVVTGNNFVANIKENQAPGLKSYLLDNSTNDDGDYEYPVNGIVVDATGNTYAIAHDGDNYILAGNGQFAVLGQDINIAYGTEELMTGTNIIALDTELDLAGFTVNPELALNEGNLDNKYFTVGANGELMTVGLDFNYANIDNFTAISAENPERKIGFDISGDREILFADVTASYEAYEGEGWDYFEHASSVKEIRAEMAEEFAGYNVTADAAYRSFAEATDEASRKEWNVNAANEYGNLDVEGNIEFAKETEGFFNIMKVTDKEDEFTDEDYTEADNFFNKSLALTYQVNDALTTASLINWDKNYVLDTTFNADYVLSEALKTGAELSTADVAADANWRSKFFANYVEGIYTADLTKYMNDEENDNDMIVEVTVRPKDFNLFDVNVSPYADFAYKVSDENTSNHALGVDLEKALFEHATLTANYEHANRDYDLEEDGIAGTRITKSIGVNYQINSDLDAGVNYEELDFTAAEATTDNYNVRKASAGVELAF